VDKTISANTRYIFMFRDDAIEIPVEEKVFAREDCRPEKLIKIAREQILSHCAKHVGIGFNFAGKGIDTRATGVILNPACVVILQLQLVNMGKPTVELILLETDVLPILSKENFDTWVNGSEDPIFRQKLYPEDSLPNPEVVPKGIVALWTLMTSTRKDLVGPSVCMSTRLGNMIGFGTFAAVYKDVMNEDQVIKLSRYGAKTALKREAEVLKALCSPDFLPCCCSSDDLEVEIGGVPFILAALVMAPLGISIEMRLAGITEGAKNSELVKMGGNIVAALAYIHGKGYVHNDISPNNIMFNTDKSVAFLIDFGLASTQDEKLSGFCGTALYSHNDIFNMYPRKKWNCKPAYDCASLALSMAVLSQGGKCPWTHIRPPDKVNAPELFNDCAQKRAETAWQCLEGRGFDQTWYAWCINSAGL
jgi:hypothetical protein